MKKIVLSMLGLFVFACVNRPASETSASQDIEFSYCTYDGGGGGRVLCRPLDATESSTWCNSICMQENGEPGYCPDYTPAEYDECAQQCFTEWGQQHCDNTCLPSTFKNCILGEEP